MNQVSLWAYYSRKSPKRGGYLPLTLWAASPFRLAGLLLHPTRSRNRHSWRGFCSRGDAGRREERSPPHRHCSRLSGGRPCPRVHPPFATSRRVFLPGGRCRSRAQRGCRRGDAWRRVCGRRAPLLVPRHLCTAPVASVENKGAIFASGEHVLRLLTPPATQPRGKDGGLDG